jgi:hypothetical protein
MEPHVPSYPRNRRVAGGQAMARPGWHGSACPPADVVYSIQLSKSLLPKSRGAANGKLETSRGRKKSAQEYLGALAEVSTQAAHRVK